MFAAVSRAFRRLLRAPAFTLPAVATLALGTAAAVAVFALVHSVLLDPLPYPDPDRLVILRHVAPGESAAEGGQSDGTYQHYRTGARSFADIGVYFDRDLSLTDGETPERISAAFSSVRAVLSHIPRKWA